MRNFVKNMHSEIIRYFSIGFITVRTQNSRVVAHVHKILHKFVSTYFTCFFKFFNDHVEIVAHEFLNERPILYIRPLMTVRTDNRGCAKLHHRHLQIFSTYIVYTSTLYTPVSRFFMRGAYFRAASFQNKNARETLHEQCQSACRSDRPALVTACL